MLQTIYSAFERLFVAEGDRRRVRIELHEPVPEEQSARYWLSPTTRRISDSPSGWALGPDRNRSPALFSSGRPFVPFAL
ncbi:phage terminase small subunit [Streptomyces sp. NPDC004365]